MLQSDSEFVVVVADILLLAPDGLPSLVVAVTFRPLVAEIGCEVGSGSGEAECRGLDDRLPVTDDTVQGVPSSDKENDTWIFLLGEVTTDECWQAVRQSTAAAMREILFIVMMDNYIC